MAFYPRRRSSLPTCTCCMPRTVNGRRIRAAEFCAVCPDADLIPAECPGTCDPADRDFSECLLATECPCAQPDTPSRCLALANWLHRPA